MERTATPPPRLYLASHSPRRAELLRQIGVAYRQLAVTVDESPHTAEAAARYVLRIAWRKAEAGRQQLLADPSLPVAPVLGADTAVVLQEGEILGKPQDGAEARRMLARLSATTHQVMTGVALLGEAGGRSRICCSRVTFRPLTAAEIDRYVASGEPLDKAGSYAIQGRGALFVRHLEGSYSGVMGLPLFETGELLREVGVALIEG